MDAEGSHRRQRSEDDEEEKAQRERAKKAYERLKSLSTAMSTREASRTARRLSRWANPLHMQWKDVNNTVTTSMVKEVWPCSDAETLKGRWKVSKCLHEDMKKNAETIAMEVFGQPLHNHDAPLYFAKMLYMQFVLEQPVDFSSKEVSTSLVDVRATSVTLSKDELQLALEGAQLELMQQKELLQKRLDDKEQEAQRILQAATPPPRQGKIEEGMTQIRADINSLSQRLPVSSSTSTSAHLMNIVLHPEAVIPPMDASSSTINQCPSCHKRFDTWSGHYMLACTHFYHLSCLIRSMVLGEQCHLCSAPFPLALYRMFGMQAPQVSQRPQPHSTPSAFQNLNFENLDDTQSQR